MPISRMKAGRFIGRVFVYLLILAVAMPTLSSKDAFARRERNSYAGVIADLRVSVSDLATEISDLEEEYNDEKERCKELKSAKSKRRSIYSYDEDSDPTYGDDSCECDLFKCNELYYGVDYQNESRVEDRLDLFGLNKDIFETDTFEYVEDCDDRDSGQTDKEHNGGRLVKKENTENKENKENAGNKGKADDTDDEDCGAKVKVKYVRIKPEEQRNVCVAVFNYLEAARSDSEFDKRRRNVTSSCIDAAKECGPNRKKIDRETCDDVLKDLKDKIASKKKKKEELELRIASMIQACPDCSRGGGNGGAIAVGLAQALAPVAIAGIGSAMYFKSLNKSADVWDAYYKQCVIIGVPCNAPMGMGGFGAGIGGGFGAIGGSFGAIGGGFGQFNGGMFAPGVGGGIAIGGMFAPGIGGVGVFNGGMFAPGIGQFNGGMFAPGIGQFNGGMFAPGIGQFNGGMFAPGIGGGIAIGGGFGQFNGGMFAPGIGGGIANSFAGFSAGNFGTFAGGFANGIANAMSGGYSPFSIGAGAFNPYNGMALQMQQQQVYQQDLMIAQQAMYESQMRYQQSLYQMSMGGYMGAGLGNGILSGIGSAIGIGTGFTGMYYNNNQIPMGMVPTVPMNSNVPPTAIQF